MRSSAHSANIFWYDPDLINGVPLDRSDDENSYSWVIHILGLLSPEPGPAQPGLAMRPEPAPSQAGSCAGPPEPAWGILIPRKKGPCSHFRCHVIVQVPTVRHVPTGRQRGPEVCTTSDNLPASHFLHKEVSATSAACHGLPSPSTADHPSQAARRQQTRHTNKN